MEKEQIREVIARRVAMELHDGDVVNLGIGLPTLVPNYLPEGVEVILQTENGLIGADSCSGRRRPGLDQCRRWSDNGSARSGQLR